CLETWTKRKNGQVNFFLTEVLSGHGCFKGYLHRFGHEESGGCSRCGQDVEETAEHALFSCVKFESERRAVESLLHTSISVENLVAVMLRSKENSQGVSSFAAAIMGKLRIEERRRNQEE
ncbi:hypothetical protein KR059_003390, partial [Drosophila kikkawai]